MPKSKRQPASKASKSVIVTKTKPAATAAKTIAGPLPSVWKLSRQTITTLWQQRRLLGGVVFIYGVLNLLLVKGFASTTSVGSLKTQFSQNFSGHFGSLAANFAVFTNLAGSNANGSSAAAGTYQLVLLLLVSLALIWSLRQIFTGNVVRIRDAYYQGMYPLVPFILVVIVVSLQLVPLVIGSAIYSLVIANGIAVHAIEQVLWLALFTTTAAVSLYLTTSSLFALYIVTLPDMTPLKALRSARGLVRNRRWAVLRKLLFLPLALVIIIAIIMLPTIAVAAALAQWLFFGLSIVAIAVAHSYIYLLYRELIRE